MDIKSFSIKKRSVTQQRSEDRISTDWFQKKKNKGF